MHIEGVSGVGVGVGVEGMRVRAPVHRDPAHTNTWAPAQVSSASEGMGIDVLFLCAVSVSFFFLLPFFANNSFVFPESPRPALVSVPPLCVAHTRFQVLSPFLPLPLGLALRWVGSTSPPSRA